MKIIYDKESLPGVRVLVARIESYDQEYLRQQGLEVPDEKTNGLKRKVQSYFARKLLCEALGNKKAKTDVDELGKPFLPDKRYEISFSHTQDLVAVALSNSGKTGIDIEATRDKIEQIAHKFMSDQETQEINKNIPLIESLTLYWSAKEAMYKLHGKRLLDYREHLYVAPFTVYSPGNFSCKIEKGNELINCRGFFEKVEEHYLVIVAER